MKTQNAKEARNVLDSQVSSKSVWIAHLLFGIMFCFMCFVFSPIELVQVNSLSFSFGPTMFAWRFVLYGFVAFVLLEAFLWGVFKLFKPAYYVLFAVLFGIGIAFYVQGTYLCMDNQIVGDSKIFWNTERAIPAVINLFVWGILCIAPLVILLFKPKFFYRMVSFLSGAIMAMLIVAFCYTLSIDNANNPIERVTPSANGIMDVSGNGDVITFMLDTTDTRYLDEIMQKEPEVLAEFDGFTFYHNMAASYRKTAASSVNILTGELYLNQEPFTDFATHAFEKSKFFSAMKENGINVDLYLQEYRIRIPKSMLSQIDNLFIATREVRDIKTFDKYLFRSVVYRSGPFFLQPFLFMDFSTEINKLVESNTSGYPGYVYAPTCLKGYVERDGLNIVNDKRYFKFYHLQGSHFFFVYDRKGNKVEESTQYDQTIGNFYILSEYLKQMKEAGIYDKSTIIVMADHGDGTVCSPMFMMKPAGQHGPITMNTAPTSMDDYRATVLSAFGIDHQDFGRTVDEILPNEKRERHFYSYNSTLLRGVNTYFSKMTEYIIPDDATDVENYIPTGTVFSPGKPFETLK